jgi:hypothetical protein
MIDIPTLNSIIGAVFMVIGFIGVFTNVYNCITLLTGTILVMFPYDLAYYFNKCTYLTWIYHIIWSPSVSHLNRIMIYLQMIKSRDQSLQDQNELTLQRLCTELLLFEESNVFHDDIKLLKCLQLKLGNFDHDNRETQITFETSYLFNKFSLIKTCRIWFVRSVWCFLVAVLILNNI